jgi:hypothetical protein
MPRTLQLVNQNHIPLVPALESAQGLECASLAHFMLAQAPSKHNRKVMGSAC